MQVQCSNLFPALAPAPQAIVSADVAYKRDFFATASRDLTVRLWQTCPLRLVLTHMCHHSPQALSIDPYGRCAMRHAAEPVSAMGYCDGIHPL